MLIIDTSVLIDFFKGKNTPHTRFFSSFEDQGGSIALPSFVVTETLQGAGNEREWKLLDTYLNSQEILYPDPTPDFLRKSGKIFYDLRRKGKTVRSTIDCMIAQISLDSDSVLLHNDIDFEIIKSIRPLKTWRP